MEEGSGLDPDSKQALLEEEYLRTLVLVQKTHLPVLLRLRPEHQSEVPEQPTAPADQSLQADYLPHIRKYSGPL